MPGQDFMGPALKADVLSGKVSNATIDKSVSRILTQMYKFGLFDNMNQWNGSTHQQVRSRVDLESSAGVSCIQPLIAKGRHRWCPTAI
eukprot:COSAG02_NODE_10249_length_1986_cov_3.648649_1_plen_87_part_10